jgi:hypothetical protein
VKIFNLCTKKSYEKNGETKTVWLTCGTLRETEDGKRFVELNHLPGITFYCFEPRKKEPSLDDL